MGIIFDIRKKILEKQIAHEKVVNTRLENKIKKDAQIERLQEKRDIEIKKLNSLRTGHIKRGVSTTLTSEEQRLLTASKERHQQQIKKRRQFVSRVRTGTHRALRSGRRLLRGLG